MRWRLALLMTCIAGCEAGCAGAPIVPNIVVPNTAEIHEFHVGPVAAKELHTTFLNSVEEEVEKAVCLVGELIWVDKEDFIDPNHQEERHLQLRLLDTYPADVDSATATRVWYSSTPCASDAFGRAHTHIISGDHSTHLPSEMDVYSLWSNPGQYLSIIIWGVGVYEGEDVVGTTWRFKHGTQNEWIIPLKGGT